MSKEKNKAAGTKAHPKKVKKKKERQVEEPVVLPPAFWLFMLALPFFALLVTYVFRDDPPPPDTALAQQAASAAQASPHDPRTTHRGRGTIAPPEETIPMEKLKACDFEDWVGKPLNKPLLKRHLLPSRIIMSGSKVKPGGDPLVLNVEIDERLIVTKVWCG